MSGEQMDCLISAYAQKNTNKNRGSRGAATVADNTVLSSCTRPSSRHQQRRPGPRGPNLVWIDGYGLVRFG